MISKDSFKKEIISVVKLTDSDKDLMFRLMSMYYENLNKDNFYTDLNEKNWVIMIRDEKNSIIGFTTIKLFDTIFNNENILILFSGDTIVDKNYWQHNFLVGPFGHFLLYFIENYNEKPIYWFLISKGQRTYRFLPLYFKEFYPCYNKETPKYFSDLIDTIATDKFGKDYDPIKKIISYKKKKDFLKEELNIIEENKKNNPHINFFVEKNPNYLKGDELVCISPITKSNLQNIALRFINSVKVEWIK